MTLTMPSALNSIPFIGGKLKYGKCGNASVLAFVNTEQNARFSASGTSESAMGVPMLSHSEMALLLSGLIAFQKRRGLDCSIFGMVVE